MPYRSVSVLVGDRAVTTVTPEVSVRQAATIMTDQHIGALPVLQNGKLVGIFTERDIVSRVIVHGLDVDVTSIDKVMTPEPETISSNQPLCEALDIMHEGDFRHLPVVDNDRVVGILSMRDIPAEYQIMRNNWMSAKSGVSPAHNYQI